MARTYKINGEYSLATQNLQVKDPDYHHKQIALLVALGWSTKNIAIEMQMTLSRVSLIKMSPLMKPIIEGYRARIEEKAIAESMACRLQEEFHTSMDKLAELRDTSIEETIQLGASKFMVEKAVDVTIPKKTITEEHKKVGIVMLNGDDLARLSSVKREIDETIEIEAEAEADGEAS